MNTSVRRRHPWCLVAAGLTIASCTPAVERSAPGLIGAREAAADEHPAAVAILATYGAQGQVFCSGVMLLPDVVLTAGHCVSTFAVARQQVGASIRFWVSGQADLRAVAQGQVPADATLVHTEVAHPSWVSSENLWTDLGLLFLEAPRAGEPRPALLPIGAEPRLVPGLKVTAVGWGLNQDSPNAASEQKRLAKVELAAVTSAYVGFGGPRRGGNSLACSGDSGGPLLVEEGGALVVVGVMTRSDCRTFTGSIRPDRHRAFLLDTMSAACGDGRRPACLEALPPELPISVVPEVPATTLPAALLEGIELGCAREAALCDDPFPDGDECRIALSNLLGAAPDPACTAELEEAVACLGCMANACYATCAECADLDDHLLRCVNAPLPTPDAGVTPDAGSVADAEPIDLGEGPGADVGVVFTDAAFAGTPALPEDAGSDGCRDLKTSTELRPSAWWSLLALGLGLSRGRRRHSGR